MYTFLEPVAENNDHTIKQTDNLKIILLNLQIESAHIKESNGVKPIADELQKIIHELHDKTFTTVNSGRKQLINGLNVIEKYIESNIKVGD